MCYKNDGCLKQGSSIGRKGRVGLPNYFFFQIIFFLKYFFLNSDKNYSEIRPNEQNFKDIKLEKIPTQWFEIKF